MRRLAPTIVVILLLASCTRTRYATREMTWTTEARSAVFHTLSPDSVRLTFVESPDDHIILGGVPNLVEHLRRGRGAAVPAYFEVHCAWWGRQVRWYTLHTVDGLPAIPASGGAERTGNSRAPDPLASVCP